MTEDEQIAVVKTYDWAIELFNNPSEAVQLIAVRQDGTGTALYYIKNPSEKVQLEAVKQHGGAIKFIKNPSENVKALHLALWEL